MLRILSSTTGIGPRAVLPPSCFYTYEYGTGKEIRTRVCNRYIDVATEYFYPHTHARTHTHTHSEHSRGNKSINSRLRWLTHVEVVKALVFNDVVTKENTDFLLLPRPQQLKLDVTCNVAIYLGTRQARSRLRSPTNGNAVCITRYCPAVALLYEDFQVIVCHFSRCLLLKNYCSLE